jgi:hypothetical protein
MENNRDSIAWQSTLTEGMLQDAGISEQEVSLMINELNDAVAEIMESYDVGR